MEERRQHPRYESGQVKAPSLYLTAHDLADGPIGPVDFSSGGFGVRLSRRPLQGSVVSCTLHVRGVALSGIPVRVSWIREEEGPPRVWSVGLAVQMDEDERGDFVTAMTGLLAEIVTSS